MLPISKINSQNYKVLYDSLKSEVPSIKLEGTLDSIIRRSNDANHLLKTAKMAHAFSVKFFLEANFDRAIKYGLIEIESYDALKIVNKDYVKGLYQLGIFYQRNNELKKARSYYEKVIDLNIDTVKVAQAYCKLGSCSSVSGDYYKSVDYYKKGISILEKLNEYNELAKRYLDLVIIYGRINTPGSLNSRIDVLKKVDKISSEIPISNENFDRLNNSYANHYNTASVYDFKKAKKYYNRLLVGSDSSRVRAAYTNLGNLYIKEKNDSAIWFLKKSLSYPGNKNLVSLTYHNVCNFYFGQNNMERALEYIHKAIVVSTQVDENYTSLPTTQDLQRATNKYTVLDLLTRKATVLIKLYEQRKNLDYINQALNNVAAADTLIDILQEKSFEEQSRLHWRKEASKLYLKGILCCELLNKNELAFSFSEKNKALLLTESILNNASKINLPEEVISKENALKKEILHIESLQSNKNESAETNDLQNQLFDARLAYQNYIDSLESVFPEYYSHESKAELFSLDRIRAQLDNNTVIISYVWGKEEDQFDALFGVSISKEDAKIFKITNSEEVEKLVKAYTSAISKPFETTKEQDYFNNISHQLFNKLFPTEKIRTQISDKHLLVIPDNDLQNISFEALILNKDTNEYLIESSEISYAYSMSFLIHNDAIARNAEKNFIGFSPTTFQSGNLDTLTHTVAEIQALQNIVGGTKYINTNASKSRFIDESDNYKIIHLATHANASANPWIAFNDVKLESHELYTFKNQADLVVLSACNTSIGQIADGEGVMSLARGFFYAGANSVVSTLWSANDKSTRYIMEEFYKNLKQGNTKSRALHQAKLQYIRSHSLSDASPYYWASFVLIGNSEAISFSSDYLFFTITIILLFILLGYFLRKRLIKSKLSG